MKTLKNQSGFSLIELLVAVAIGGFLIIGAVTMQSNTRKTFTINEQQARLQETARYVFSVIEPELQLAGEYGFSNRAEDLRWDAGGNSAQAMRGWSTQVSGLPAILEQCKKHYGVDVMSSIEAANNSFGLTCAAQGGGHNGTSDTLTIRHAGQIATTATASKFQLQTVRLSQFASSMFISSTAPSISADVIGDHEIRDMVVETYYIAINSDARAGLPALRVKTLTTNGTAPVMDDQEVIRGVEDIQVEFGVDPGVDQDGDGLGDIASGFTQRYVAPDNVAVRNGQPSAVRLWVRTRAEDPEQGYINNKTYSYAGVNFTPNDRYRRVLMSRTIYLRNSRGMEYSIK